MSEELSKIIINKANILKLIEDAWNKFHQYIGTLSEKQITEPKDEGGWTVKDHMIHLAIWEDSLRALLEKRSRPEAMGIDESLWEQGNVDAVNDVIQKRYQNMPLEEVLATLKQCHEKLLATINAMSDEDLMRPHRDFQAHSEIDNPIYHWIAGNTFDHYEEHLSWIQEIVSQA